MNGEVGRCLLFPVGMMVSPIIWRPIYRRRDGLHADKGSPADELAALKARF